MRLIYPIAALLLLISTACKKKNDITERIKDDITVMLTPPQSTSGKAEPFALSCKTKEEHECTNYSIGYTLARTDKGYEIKFTDIKKPEICLTAFGPATATIPLDLKPGNYELNFVLRGKTNQFTLSVKDGTYEITGGNGSNVTMGNTKVLSVPADTYWGTMWDHTGDDMTMHYTWLDSALKKKGLTPAKMEPGDYRSFTVDANGNYAGVGAPNEISYIYKYTGDVNELKPLFEQFPDSVTVRLQNAQNILLTN